MPYGMALLSCGLMDQFFAEHPPTLGEAVLKAKQRMLRPAADDPRRAALDGLAMLLSPARNLLAEERAEHVWMFNLLGDPLLRLRFGQVVRVQAAAGVSPGGVVEIEIDSPIDGQATIELVLRRDRMKSLPPRRDTFTLEPDALANYQAAFLAANDRRLAATQTATSGGKLKARLQVPQEAEGPCHICVSIEGRDDFAIGSADVMIKPMVRSEGNLDRRPSGL
jgi:hypothetical protein